MTITGGRASDERGEMAAMNVSKAASILASIKTPARAAAARENGKKGGRPPRCELIFDVRLPDDAAGSASAPRRASIRVPRRVAAALAKALVAGPGSDPEVLGKYLPRIRAAAAEAGGEFSGFRSGVSVRYPDGRVRYFTPHG